MRVPYRIPSEGGCSLARVVRAPDGTLPSLVPSLLQPDILRASCFPAGFCRFGPHSLAPRPPALMQTRAVGLQLGMLLKHIETHMHLVADGGAKRANPADSNNELPLDLLGHEVLELKEDWKEDRALADQQPVGGSGE